MGTKRITDLAARTGGITDSLYFPADDGIESFKIPGSQFKTYLNALAVSTYTGTNTQLATDSIVMLDATSGAFTLTLLSATLVPGRRVIFIKTNTSLANQVTLGGTVGGITSPKLSAPGERLVMVSNGTAWYIESWQGFGDSLALTDASIGGNGAVNTAIRRFDTVLQNVGAAMTYATSSNNGASVTINYPGIYMFSYNDRHSAGTSLGLSLNSANLTTSVASLTWPELLCWSDVTSAGIGSPATYTGQFALGDVVRPHTGTAPNTTSFPTCQFRAQRIG